jgi:uncharacterized membrane protein YccC
MKAILLNVRFIVRQFAVAGLNVEAMKWASIRGRWRILSRRGAEIRHGLRIAAAGLLSFVLGTLLGLPQSYWAVFTAVLVVQGSVGGSWKASVDRLLGTLLGAVYGAAIATIVPHDNPFMVGVALAASLTPLALLAAFNASYRVAPITAVILLLGSSSSSEGPIVAAFLRTLEVGLGGFVGMAVSLFVLPARAHALMGNAANRVLQRLAELLPDLVEGLLGQNGPTAVVAHQDAVRVALTALENVSDEAARERRNYLADDADPEPVTRTLRRVRHDLVLIGRVAAEPLPEEMRPELRLPLEVFSNETRAFLRAIGQSFAQRIAPPAPDAFAAALHGLLSALEGIKGDERIITLRFALEQLERNLMDLVRRAEEFARSPGGVAES